MSDLTKVDQALERIRSLCLELIRIKTGADWTVEYKRDGWDFQFSFRCGDWAAAAPCGDLPMSTDEDLKFVAELWTSLVALKWQERYADGH